MRRPIAVIKMREHRHDLWIREFASAEAWRHGGAPFAEGEALLSGFPHVREPDRR